MTPPRPQVSGILAPKTWLREPDGAAGGDFAWPPPADDPAQCSIVMLETEAAPWSRPRTAMRDDEPMEAFPEIDLDTALDAFADLPAAPRVLPVMREVWRRDRPVVRPPVSRRRAAGIRALVAVCIGASMALMPSPGLPRVPNVRPRDVPAKAQPRAAASRGIRTLDRVVSRTVADSRPGHVMPRDEDHIRTTLAELRSAYSQLDADAAREVWPSVDVTALARAFDDLKSQDLHFDHCDVSVDGARARAACTGEAVYVPRVGNAASSRAWRAWTFELTRVRERWMIASARAI